MTDPARARQVDTDSAGLLSDTFAGLGARRVLDAGCGSGDMVAHLAGRGFDATGIDPSPAAVAAARARYPGLPFAVAGAQAVPPALGRFDGACLVNALHHVPPDTMLPALHHLLDRAGALLVIEPLADGSFFHAMQPVEDETVLRRLAVQAIARLVDSGGARLVDLLRWDRVSIFPDAQGFLNRLVAVDPARTAAIAAHGPAIAAAWAAHAEPAPGGFRLVQPLVCWHLAPPG